MICIEDRKHILRKLKAVRDHISLLDKINANKYRTFACNSEAYRYIEACFADKSEPRTYTHLIDKIIATLDSSICDMEISGQPDLKTMCSQITWKCSKCGEVTYNQFKPNYCLHCGSQNIR